MAQIRDFEAIRGVQIAELNVWKDERGQFLETFRKEWFPQRTWERVQTNHSESQAGVLRGLHYHHHQVDYWYVPRGMIRIAFADLRPDSPTYLKSAVLEIGETNPVGVYIPVGVAHGFVALTNATLPYTLQLANKGWKQALRDSPALLKGLNVTGGKVTYPGVAEAFGMDFHEPAQFVA